jgi:hypothetical protein
VVTRAQNAAPFAAGAVVTVSQDPVSAAAGDAITVRVTRAVDSPVAGFVGGGITLDAEATQRAE